MRRRLLTCRFRSRQHEQLRVRMHLFQRQGLVVSPLSRQNEIPHVRFFRTLLQSLVDAICRKLTVDFSLSRDGLRLKIGEDDIQDRIICYYGSERHHLEGVEERLDLWAGLISLQHT
jgi:hypothetical protein